MADPALLVVVGVVSLTLLAGAPAMVVLFGDWGRIPLRSVTWAWLRLCATGIAFLLVVGGVGQACG